MSSHATLPSHPPTSTTAGPEVGFTDVLAHLAVALSIHERRMRGRGVPVPPLVGELAAFLRDCARIRQDPPSMDKASQGAHDHETAKLLLTKGDAAMSLSVSVRTVERLIAGGRLPVVHVEGSCRIRAVDIASYVAGLAVGSTGSTPAEAPPAEAGPDCDPSWGR
jgi:excisionase family DNA binding protein